MTSKDLGKENGSLEGQQLAFSFERGPEKGYPPAQQAVPEACLSIPNMLTRSPTQGNVVLAFSHNRKEKATQDAVIRKIIRKARFF